MNSQQLDTFIASLSDPELADLLHTAQNNLRTRKLQPWDKEDSDIREMDAACFAMRCEIIKREAQQTV